MKPLWMRHGFRVFHLGVKAILNAGPLFFILFSAPFLSACVMTKASTPLVPPPPTVSYQDSETGGVSAAAAFFAEEPQVYDLAADSGFADGAPALQAVALQGLDAPGAEVPRFEESKPVKTCSLGDRFDRGEVIAYEWDRSRLGVDVDGLNMGGGGMDAVKLQYTLRLQHERSSEQACRYPSAWQGIAGSAYNELFLRQEDTVWQELRAMRRNFLSPL